MRRLGWELLGVRGTPGDQAMIPQLARPGPDLLDAEGRYLCQFTLAERRSTVLIGIDEPAERARLLALGFGDALVGGTSLEELEQRALRLVERLSALPRSRRIGSLCLDLMARQAFVAGRALDLHPREFALLWRLSERSGEALGVDELLGEIWRLSFRPETNSLAVHVSRLRAKLRLAGIEGLIRTLPDGAYCLRAPAPSAPIFRNDGNLPLDARACLGEDHHGAPQSGQTGRQPCSLK